MNKLVGAAASAVVALALAAGAAFGVTAVSAPDNNVDFVDQASPIGASGFVNYGTS